jgi:hypothetical protein
MHGMHDHCGYELLHSVACSASSLRATIAVCYSPRHSKGHLRNAVAIGAIDQEICNMRNAMGISAVLAAAVAMMMFASGQTMANPEIAKKTGEACAKCHTAPPALNDYGKKYKK